MDEVQKEIKNQNDRICKRLILLKDEYEKASPARRLEISDEKRKILYRANILEKINNISELFGERSPNERLATKRLQ